jgi:hypothetical protein
MSQEGLCAMELVNLLGWKFNCFESFMEAVSVSLMC